MSESKWKIRLGDESLEQVPPQPEPSKKTAPQKALFDTKKGGYEPFNSAPRGKYLLHYLWFTLITESKKADTHRPKNCSVTVKLGLSICK